MIFKRIIPYFRSRQAGVTLLELTIVLFVGALFVQIFYQFTEAQLRDKQISSTRESLLIISEGLYTYRLTSHTPPAPAEWPADWTALASYLPTFSSTNGGRNGVGQRFVLDPPANLQTRVDPYMIQTDMLTNERAERLRREFPGQAGGTGSTVAIEIPIPGHEPARDALLARDGTRAMEDALNMDSNDLDNAGTVNAQEVVTTGNLNVGGEGLQPTGVRFLNLLAGLNCGSRVVTVQGGTPRCTNAGGGGGGTPIGTPSDTPEVTTPAQPTCPTTPPARPATLDSRATWTCTPRWTVDSGGTNVCTLGCRSGCGSGFSLMPRYRYPAYGSTYYSSPTGDDCQSSYSCTGGASPTDTYSTTAGTCISSSCGIPCRDVR